MLRLRFSYSSEYHLLTNHSKTQIGIDHEQSWSIFLYTLFLIFIEDKYYDKLRDNDGGVCQLEIYKERFDKHYATQSEEWHKHYLLISCIDREDEKFEKYYSVASLLGFKTFSFYEIFGKNRQACESDIFNEFWINW